MELLILIVFIIDISGVNQTPLEVVLEGNVCYMEVVYNFE